MKKFSIMVADEATEEVLDSFEIEVYNEDDIDRLSHPLAQQEHTEQIKEIIRSNWDLAEEQDD